VSATIGSVRMTNAKPRVPAGYARVFCAAMHTVVVTHSLNYSAEQCC